MSPQNRLRSVLNRIASRTNVIRTRVEDADRATRHGDPEKERRLLAAVERLERVADELEAI